MSIIKALLRLTKPGVLIGNALTVPAGFLLASTNGVDWSLLWSVFGGSTLIIASACVINNYFDQDIDAKMERTKTRPLIEGQVPGWLALSWGIVLGLIGFAWLIMQTNYLVVIAGLIGYIDYIVLYGMLSKRLSWHGTLVGSISGAIPILAGYLAASGQIGIGAVLVFAILFVWQMPEFYAIAIYRQAEYAAAQVPVVTVVKNVETTIKYIWGYSILFAALCLLLPFFNFTGLTYTIVMIVSLAYWLWFTHKGFSTQDPTAWSRKLFKLSMRQLLLFCLLLSINNWVP